VKEKKKSGKNRGGARSKAGRKPGVPNKINQEVKEFVRGIVDFKAMIEKYRDHAMRGKINPVKVDIFKLLMAYGLGKPPQPLEITGDYSREQVDALRSIADTVMGEMV
jgi:hypothetical protein